MQQSITHAILNSMQTRIAVIDPQGTILLVNDSWTRFAQENGDPDQKTTGEGINYIDVTRRAAALGDASAPQALAGIDAVLLGKQAQFELKYPCHAPTHQRWFLMRVTPLRDNGMDVSGAVVAHIDITTQHLEARAATRTAARSQAKRAVRHEQSRQLAREQAALTTMSGAVDHHVDVVEDDKQAVNTTSPVNAEESALIDRYNTLLENAIQRRSMKLNTAQEHAYMNEARAFAAALGRQTTSPRELVRIHTRVMEQKQRDTTSPARIRVIMEEGRLLLLELMGYLANYYRELILADLELRNL